MSRQTDKQDQIRLRFVFYITLEIIVALGCPSFYVGMDGKHTVSGSNEASKSVSSSLEDAYRYSNNRS